MSRPVNDTTLSKMIGFNVKQEKGNNQFEIDIDATDDIKQLINDIRNAREQIISRARQNSYVADFTSKPHSDDYGSAMHFHLNFTGDLTPEELANILCNYAKQTLQYFLPTKEAFSRLDSRFMSPTHICWGGNNRTCLIRIPDQIPRRIEHRLAGADIDPIYPVYAMLASVAFGLENPKLQQFHKIHGNAYDEQYGLEKIFLS